MIPDARQWGSQLIFRMLNSDFRPTLNQQENPKKTKTIIQLLL